MSSLLLAACACFTSLSLGAETLVSNSFDLATAVANAKPGDTIVMRDGAWNDADILFTAEGSAAQPITLRAQTLGRVHLTGLSRLRLAGNHLVVDGLTFTNGYRTSGDVIAFQDSSAAVANHSRLTNCSIVDYNPPDPASDTKYVSLYGVSNRVENCYFRGKTNAGSTLVVWVSTQPNSPNDHVIARNYFGFRPALGVNGGETIRIGTSDVSLNSSRTTVEENFFERCNGDAEFVSVKSCENLIRHNTFYECEGALTLRHGNGNVVEGNYFFGNRKPLTGGVRIIGDDHRVYNNYFVDLAGTSSRAPLAIMQGLVDSPLNGYFQVHRASVAFNTFVNCTNAFVIGLSGTLSGTTNVTTLPPVDCVVANNIVSQPAGRIVDQRITPQNLLWEGNILFGATLGISTNSGTSRANPLLQGGADGLWRPSLSSPALGAAQGTYEFVVTDIEGQPRPGTKDIGCDQLSIETLNYPPLTSSNVGPLFMRARGTFLVWKQPADISFGTALSAAQLNAFANAAGSFAYDPPAGTILNAGSNQPLQVIFTPTDLIEFNIATQVVTITVAPGTPLITWTNPSAIRYGAPLGSVQLNASANTSGDFTYSPAAGTTLDVGSNQTLSLTFTPADTNNYLSATKSVSIDVVKGVPQITWHPPPSIEQGVALGAAELNASADVPGTFTYTPAAGTALLGGTRVLTAQFTPGDAAHFESATATSVVEVTIGGKRVPQVTWTNPPPLLVGAPLGVQQLNAVASVPGRFIYSPPLGTVLPMGPAQTLTSAFIPDDDETFTSVTNTVLVDVAALSSNSIVRMAYLIPSNRSPQSHGVETLRRTMLMYQQWLAVQMERNGFGHKSFTVELESDGVTPMVHVLPLRQTDQFLRGDAFGARIIEAAQGAGLPVGAPNQLWFIVPESHVELPDGGITGSFQIGKRLVSSQGDSGWAVLGSDQLALLQSQFQTNTLPYHGFVIPQIGPFPLVDEVSFAWFDGSSLSAISSAALGGGLRTIGLALGLEPDYRNDENFNGNVMGFGFRGMRGVFYPKLYPYNFCALSYASALALDVNPFLNPGRLLTDSNLPTVTNITAGVQTPVSGLLEIRFTASDEVQSSTFNVPGSNTLNFAASGLHAALLTWERDGEMRIAEEVVLNGDSTAQSFWTAFFDVEATNRYAITVFDKQGNRRVAETTIYPRATFNRSPQPFIVVRPLVAGLGQDIVMDASQSFDAEGASALDGLLEVQWDVDGDGFFDTEPSTNPIYTNNYFSLGTRVVRARLTDPAGGVAISAPVAVNITTCPTTLSPLTRFHGFAGSTGVVEVTVGTKCEWLVVNTNDWIEITSVTSESAVVDADPFDGIDPSPLSGAGEGKVVYNVLPNSVFADREGYLLIGDEVFLVRQHAVECSVSLSPTSRFHGFGTGTGTFKVTTKAACEWEVVNTNGWILITGGATGQGTGTVSYAIADNRVTGRRSGNLVVGTAVYTVNQWGTNCELVLNVNARSHSENAESGTFTVTTASGCAWLVVNTNEWIGFSAATGNTTSNVTYTLTANTTGVARTGAFSVNGLSFTVTQRACTYAVSPATRTHNYSAQSGSFEVSAGSVCGWNVVNTNDWLVVDLGYSGIGGGGVGYSILENPRGESRVANLTIAGKAVAVIQSGKPCLFSLSGEEVAFGEEGGVGEVFVTSDTGCPWSVAGVPPWISILSGANGEGAGRVSFLISPNTGGLRNTTLVIGGQDFAISQASAVRLVSVPNSAVAGGQTNCLTIALAPHGGESSFAFSTCFDTNLLVYRSAKLLTGWQGATLTLTTNQAAQGRVGFTIALQPGNTLTSTTPATVQLCLVARTSVVGRAQTTLAFCDTPAVRRLADVLGRPLPVSFAEATIDIVGQCSIADSLDVDLNWRLSSPNAWRCQTNFTHDGFDAAASATLADDEEAFFETTLLGPGVLSFWWKVSSEPDKDRLRFYLDDSEQFRIAGEVDWEWRSVNIPSGSHDVRWRYSKGSSGAGGSDRGWVDEVMYLPSPPAITTQPREVSADEGGTVVFAVAATGQGPLSYQWLRNGIALGESALVRGTHTATLTLSNVTAAQSGLYSVIVGNVGGSVASAPAALNVTPAISLAEALDGSNFTWSTSGNAPWIGQALLTHDGVDAARSGPIGDSQTSSFETTVTGPGTLTYWWRVSSEPSNDRLMFLINGTEQLRISGEVEWEQRTFVLGAGTQTLRWTYSKSSSVAGGMDRAWVDQVQFAPTPVTITAQPLDQVADPGATVAFAVSASGAPPFRFQWQRNGFDILGSTNASLTLSNVSSADIASYSVIVVNPAGSVPSSNATLQVNQILPIGEALDAPAFVWTTNGTPPWVGQTNVAHDGSDAARSGRIGDSQTNSFQTVLSGPGTLSFWWKVSSETNDRLRVVVNNVEQASIGGEVNWTWRTLAITSNVATVEWRYTKNSSSSAGQDRGWVDEVIFVPTNAAVAPIFAIHPSDRTLIAPSNASFSAIAVGSTPLAYQWLFNGAPLSNGVGVAGATTTNLILANTSPALAGEYSVIASNAVGSSTSRVANLTIISAPIITAQPANQNLVAGGTANFGVTALGTAPMAYQWMLDGATLTNNANVSGANSANLRITAANGTHVGSYSVAVTNTAGSVTSAPVSLVISLPPIVVAQPTNRTVGAGNAALLSVSASGSGPLRYQWRFNGVNLVDDAEVIGASSPTLRINNVKVARGGAYSVIVSNDVGFATSSNATLTVIAPPVITTQPFSRVVLQGTNVSFSVVATGAAPITFQWRRDGTNLVDGDGVFGVTSTTLLLSNVQPEQSGIYSVEVGNAGGLTPSMNVQLTVVPKLSLGDAVNAPYLEWTTSAGAAWMVETNVTHDGEAAVQTGATTNKGASWIETRLSGPGTLRFWWKVSSQTNADALVFLINGTEQARVSGIVDWEKVSITLPPGELVLRWSYNKDASVTSGLDRGWLDEVDFVPNNAPTAPIFVLQPQSQNVNPGETVTFSANALGTAPLSYQWRFEGQPLGDDVNILGANSSTLRLFNVRADQSGLYDCIVRNAYGLDISTQVFLSVFTTVSLPIALDTERTNVLWFTGGYSPWIGQTVETKDQFDAAQSSPLPNGRSNYVQTTLPFACAVTFWWKVSSETNRDYLRFLVNGVEQARISGQVGWQQFSYPIITNGALLRWEYRKDASGSAGLDRGWLDKLQFLAIAPVITNSAHDTNIVDQGTTIRLSVSASGTLPLTYQWRRAGTNIGDDQFTVGARTSSKLILTNAQPYQNGFYTCEVANEAGAHVSEQLYVRVNPTLPLAPALNTPTWFWETGGYSWWIGTTSGAHDGNQCARPGYTDDGHTSWMRTTLIGPGTLSFWWRASTQPNADWLKFSMNGVLQSQISGAVNWQQKVFTIPEGSSICEWAYAKDALLTNGTDQVFVDEVVFTPAPPVFVQQPPSLLVDAGTAAIINAGVRTSSGTTFRWRFNGTPLNDGGAIGGASTAQLRINPAQLSHSGVYSLVVSNAGGAVTSSNAVITVTSVMPLAPALDTTNITWVTGTPAWVGQTNQSHDGVDAARSPLLGDRQAAVLQTTFTGPGNLAFWWRTSSEQADVMFFVMDNAEQAAIAGESGWQPFSFSIPPGDHVVRWSYVKDASGSGGLDRAWVDQVTFTPTIPRFTLQPVSQVVEQGERVILSAAVSGNPPLAYQWQFNGSDIADGAGVSGARTTTLVISNAQLSHTGDYVLAVSNAAAVVNSATASLTVTPLVPLATALETTNLTWTTNGSPPWVGQTIVSQDGVDAARSGAIANGGSNSMQTTVVGPGTISFWWKVSSETNNDRLTFTINNAEQARLSGEVDWQFRTFSLNSGTQTLRWAYAKNASLVAGRDRGWVDRVVYGPLPPTILTQPAVQNIDLGGTANFRVSATGAPPLTFQWQRDGASLVNGAGISGATSSNLVVSNVQVSAQGNFRVVVTGSTGSITSSPAALNVFVPVPLAEALDNASLNWTTANTAWTGHTLVSHDGVDAARSGAIGNSGTSTLQTTVTGAGTLTFWWRVSSEAGNDFLRLFIDGSERTTISGEIPWRFVSVNLGSGAHTIEWRYTKNGGTAVGEDRGWVDEVKFGVLPPTITTQPTNTTVDPGQAASFSVVASGTTPLSYRWLFNGVPLADGANVSGSGAATLTLSAAQPAQVGFYSVIISNSAGSVTSSPALLTLWPSLAEAVDAPDITFTTGGTGETWSGRGTISHDGEDSAASGAVDDSTYTWFKTTVNGPGVLTFWWKTSSEQDHDWLRLMMDMNDQLRISGELEWQFVSFNVPSGSHEMQWRYSKNSSVAAGQDRAWVDQINFSTNGSAPPPNAQVPAILIQPTSETVDENTTVDFNVAASGTAPLRYRWFLNATNLLRDGDNIGGATTPVLTIFNVLRAQAGNYTVVITNSAGAITSSIARLTVNHLLTVAESVDADALPFISGGAMPWEGHRVITHDGIDAARSGLVVDDESTSMSTVLDGPGMLSFWWKVSSETNADVLVFSVNDLPEAIISGEVDWEQRFVPLAAGSQFLKWAYVKNGSNAAGSDRAWVDQLSFVPDSAPLAPSRIQPRGAIAPRIVIKDEYVRLFWTGTSSRAYRVEYKENLDDIEWLTLESEVIINWRTVDGEPQFDAYTATVDDQLGSRARFYRVFEY